MSEKRRYIRMSTVFPVEFELESGDGLRSRTILLQGFTRDVGEGGMCIELKSFGQETERRLQVSQLSFRLTINPTFSPDPIHARAKVIWLKKQEMPLPARYLLGVEYQDIDALARKRLIAHARRILWVPRLVFAAGLVLLGLVAFFYMREQKLVLQNQTLIQRLRDMAERKSEVAGNLVELDTRKKNLEQELERSQEELKKMAIGAELNRIREGQAKLMASYQTLNASGKAGEDAAFHQMSHWLLSHQNLRTGLVASFEGDKNLEDAAFVYDQSLAAQAFLLFGDNESARKILLFFSNRAKNESGAFYNAYDAVSGSPQENILHTGPNVWLGIAALQYESKVGSGEFMPMAQKIGDWLIRLQDDEGGLRGGPATEWVSTEHNLDAYAFLGMLHQSTHNEKYRAAQARVLSWIQKYAYSAKDSRINRGKGDATVATDTFGWAIAAIGPEVLKKIDFDADGIMDFAEKNCVVTTDFKQRGGKSIKVKGFDFAKAQHVGRGGIISCEWTAQMVVSFQMLAKYNKQIGDVEKAERYRQKANLYLNELQKMVITSPSRTGQGRGCLPYASLENVDTGHGWRTPKGSSTGSVASTAYGLFAWKEYNPLELDKGDH